MGCSNRRRKSGWERASTGRLADRFSCLRWLLSNVFITQGWLPLRLSQQFLAGCQ